MKSFLFFILLTLSACGGEEKSPLPTGPAVTEYSVQSTWWELPQYYNGVPKYSGSFGTYTAKHTPSAVSCSLGEWAVYTDNTSGVVEVYSLNLDTGARYLIHKNRIDNAHQQGSIQCIEDTLFVAVAGLGTKETGGIFTSYDGKSWERITEDYKAYYQLHGTDTFFYTLYQHNGEGGISRFIYSSCNNKRINNEGSIGSYMLSHYDGNSYHVVYNKHPKGDVDKRYGLFYRSSTDGCNWSDEVAWYSQDNKLVYLKDLNTVEDEVTALFTVSSSPDPTQGERHVYTATSEGSQLEFETNHNYTAGVLMSDGTIHFPDDSIAEYAGGAYLNKSYVNYIKRIYGNKDAIIMSTGISPKFKSDSWIIKVEL